jgi:hypothetical protein
MVASVVQPPTPVFGLGTADVTVAGGAVACLFPAGFPHNHPHEYASQQFCAARLAALLGMDYAAQGAAAERKATYFVPRDTLLSEQAEALGIANASQLYGGVVPHPFLATKLIGHPLIAEQAAAPPGWAAMLGERMRSSVLPGYSVFSAADLIEAVGRLIGDGPVRLKCAHSRGGHGQASIIRQQQVAGWIEATGDDVIADGVVVESELENAVTYSIGSALTPAIDIAYYGTQRSIRDPAGREVYGGSQLEVVRGSMQDLLQLDLPQPVADAVARAVCYEQAMESEFPAFFASRRNYDVICGEDANGNTRCGVLEQSWRLGGASPAEVLAMEALSADSSLLRVTASTHEVYGSEQQVPQHATVYFRGNLDSLGIITKFATLQTRWM